MALSGQVLVNPRSGERFVFHTTADDSAGELLTLDAGMAGVAPRSRPALPPVARSHRFPAAGPEPPGRRPGVRHPSQSCASSPVPAGQPGLVPPPGGSTPRVRRPHIDD
jgi:hypothetical protein